MIKENTLNGAQETIKSWATERGIFGVEITKDKAQSQYAKTIEEVGELGMSIAKGDAEGIKDAIGDTLITLLIQCEMQGLKMSECFISAYKEIECRQGKLINGVFVKRNLNVNDLFDPINKADKEVDLEKYFVKVNYMVNPTVRKETIIKYERAIKNFCEYIREKNSSDKATFKHIHESIKKEYMNYLVENGIGCIWNITCFKKLFKHAIKEGLIKFNPFA